MSDPDELPHSVRESTLTIMGVDLVCHHLSDGRRIFEADSVKALFEAMASGAPLSEDNAMQLAKVIRS